MADGTTRRVIEIDVKTGAASLAALREIQQSSGRAEGSLKSLQDTAKRLADAYGPVTSSQARFIQSLESQIRTLNSNRQELLLYQAAELGLAGTTDTLIRKLVDAEKATAAKGEADKKGAASIRQAEQAEADRVARGEALIQGLTRQRDAIGKTATELARLEAGSTGVLRAYDALLADIARLTPAEALRLDKLRETARTEGEAAAAEKRRSDAGQQLLQTINQQIEALRNRNALGGREPTEAVGLVQQAKAGGVLGQALPLIADLGEQERVAARLADKNRELARTESEIEAADRKHSEAGQELLATLRAQNVAARERLALGAGNALSTDAETQIKANASGVGAQVAEELAQRRELAPLLAKLADQERDLARAEDEAAAADRRRTEAGQELLATLRQQITANREVAAGVTPNQALQTKADSLGVGGQAESLIAEREATQAAAKAKLDAVAADEAKAASSKQVVSALQAEIDAFKLDRLAQIEDAAAKRGDLATVQPLVTQLRALEEERKRDADAARASAVATAEASNAKKNAIAQEQAFARSLQNTLDNYGKSQAAILRLRADQVGASAETRRLVESVIAQNKELEKVPGAAHGAASGVSGIGRELLVLTHELSQGQFKRFGGSLIVLGEQLNLGRFLFSAAGLAAGAFAAVIGTVAFELVQGAAQQAAFNRSLFLTGNAAGQTADSFKQLSSDVKASAGVTIGVASEITQELVSTGRFGPEAIGHVAVAAADLARVSSKSAEEIVGDFANITKSVADWARRSNEQYHFLDIAVYEHIQQLEAQGRTQDAVIVATDALHNALDKQKEDVGTVAKIWRTLTEAVSGALHALQEIGKTKSTGQLIDESQGRLDEAVKRRDEAKAQIQRQQDFASQNGGVTGIGSLNTKYAEDRVKQQDAAVAAAFAELKGLREQASAEKEGAALKASNARVQAEGIEARERVQQQLEHNRGGNRAEVAIRKFTTDIAKERLANDSLPAGQRLPLSDDADEVAKHLALAGDKLVQAQIDYFKKRDQPPRSPQQKAQDQLDNTADKRLADIGRETAAIDNQIKLYPIYGEAVNKAAQAKLAFDLAQGNLVGKKGASLSQDEIDRLKEAAKLQDARALTLTGVKEEAAAKKRIELISQEADADAKNERQKQEASEVANLGLLTQINLRKQLIDQINVDKPSAGNTARVGELNAEIAKRRELIDQLKRSVNARADDALARKLTAETASNNEEINKLDTENALLGLTTIERQKRLAVLKAEADVRKLLVDNPDSGTLINAESTKNVEALTDALQRNYDAQRTFEAGSARAFTGFQEDAANASKFSEKFVGDALTNMESSLQDFYTTGKFSLSKFLTGITSDILNQFAKIQLKSLLDDKSVRDNIDKALNYLKDNILPAIGPITQQIAGGFTLPTSSTPAAGAGVVGDAQSAFRASEILAQNAGGTVGDTATAAAAQATATALTSLATTGVAPTELAITSLTTTGIAPAELAMLELTRAAYTASEALSAISSSSGGSSTGGLGDFVTSLFGGGSGGSAGGAGALVGTTGYATGGVHTTLGAAYLSGFAAGGLMSTLGPAYLPSFARGGVAGFNSAPLLNFASGGIAGDQGATVLQAYARGGVAGQWAPAAPLQTFAGGGVMGHAGFARMRAFAGGGLMATPFGNLRPERYSDGGGITSTARLAVFGEGRKPEAYVPLDDGRTMQVTVKQSNGQQIAYVPLPSGKSIPVKFNTETVRQPMQAYSAGGVHSANSWARPFALGGVGSVADIGKEDSALDRVDSSSISAAANVLPYALGGVAGHHPQSFYSFATGGISNDADERRKQQFAAYGLPVATVALPDGHVVPVSVRHDGGQAVPYAFTPAGVPLPASLLSLDVLRGKGGAAGAAGPGGFGGLFGATGDDAAGSLSGLGGNRPVFGEPTIGGLARTTGLAGPAAAGGFEGLAGAVGLPSYTGRPGEAVRALAGYAGPAADPGKAIDAAGVTEQPRYTRNVVTESTDLLRRNKFTLDENLVQRSKTSTFAQGGVMHASFGDVSAFATGGVANPFGRDGLTAQAFALGGVAHAATPHGTLPIRTFSAGGIADKPMLALFGEKLTGRKREAYIPMEDGASINVTMQSEAGGHRVFAPLPNGGRIPVTLATDGTMSTAGAAASPASPMGMQAFAEGGVAGASPSSVFDNVPLVRGQTINGTAASANRDSKSGKGGGVSIVVENHGQPVSAATEETTSPGSQDRQFRIYIEAAVNEVDRRIARGGSTYSALKSRGVPTTGGLARRG